MLLIVQALDLPLELGALLGGLLLVRSEYGSAIRIAIYPFSGLLIGMFFISTGMQIDFATFFKKPLETFALVALLVFVKAWIIRNILRYSAVPRQQRIWLATVLAQSAQLVLVVALSMLTTPVLLFFAARRDNLPARQQTDTGVAQGKTADSQIIVAGFGRVGQVAANMLQENGYRTVIIDHNPDRFSDLRAKGFVGFYGDALRPDLLEAAGAARAAIIIIAIDNRDGAVDLAKRVKREYPHMIILVIGEDALELAGMSPLDAQAYAEQYRDSIIEEERSTDSK